MKGYEHLDYSLKHLSGETLLANLSALTGRDRANLALLLAHLAEVDERRLYLPAACPSMFEYCVRELRLSEDEAGRRIHAARAARKFPSILVALAEGRLHLTAVCLLAAHLKPENAEELLGAAMNKTRAEIERLLAERFPKPDLRPLVRALPAPPPEVEHALAHVEAQPPAVASSASGPQHAPAHVEPPTPAGNQPQHALARVPAERPAKLMPLAPARYGLQFTIDEATHDDLRRAQALLGHQVAIGDLAAVFGRALKALITQLEKRKFAATTRPKAAAQSPTNPRTIPAQVRREVHARDQGQCTFVSAQGRRCAARDSLEFDHIEPFARGGGSTTANLRLRCRAHNQYEADRAFGAGFMHEKRVTRATAHAAAP